MTQLKIADYKEGLTFRKYTLLVKNITAKNDTNGNPYANVILQDPTGDISMKLWDFTPERTTEIPEGCVMELSGLIVSYKEQLQLKPSEWIVLNSNDPRANPQFYLKSSPMPVQEMQNQIFHYLKLIHNEDQQLGNIVSEVIRSDSSKFLTYPASKLLHHSFVGGLAYHTCRMLKSAEQLASIYPNLNKALVYSGIILHDFGKVHELTGYIGTDYTTEGRLIGHVAMVDAILSQILFSMKIPLHDKKIMELRHILLSHHGKKEYGASVEPASREALFVHQLDNMDAKMTAYETAVENIASGKQTAKQLMFQNQTLYKS